MNQLLVYIKYKDGNEEVEYKGYTSGVYWNKQKQTVKIVDGGITDDEFENVQVLLFETDGRINVVIGTYQGVLAE